jgi:hypothetical protein
MGRHINENFLNKFLGKNLLTEEQKTAIALKNRKANYIKAHFQRLEEKKSRTLKAEIREEIDSAVNKVFYRVKENLKEAKQRGQPELVPYFTPYGVLFFNKDTQNGQILLVKLLILWISHLKQMMVAGYPRSESVRFPAVVVPPYPEVPTNLTGEGGSMTTINLTWFDNASNPEETQFIVYYRPLTYPASPTGFTSGEITNNSVNLIWQDQSTNPEEDAFQIYYYEEPS